MRWLLTCVVLLCALSAQAEQRLAVCFNYGCLAQAEVVYDDPQLRELGRLFDPARDAAQERAAIGIAVGRLLGWAGGQSPIAADRGGNYADAAVLPDERRYVVDSWFFDNGEPAAVMPLARWQAGESPHGGE